MSDNPSKKSAHKLEFKLMLEGMRVPFFSASTQETTDGVFANISLIPTENIMNLAVGTSVQLFFKEITSNPESLKNGANQWRLMFDGEFRGFNTFETAKAGSGITILCKCFRNYFRRVAMGFLFSSEFGAGATTRTSIAYGVQRVTQVDVNTQSLNTFKTKIQEFVSMGTKYAKDIGDTSNSVAERAFMSVITSFWNNTKSVNPIARNIGFRTKLIRKIIGFKNKSGFNAFQNSQMPFTETGVYNNFAQLFVSNSGMSMIENAIQEMANQYKFNFFHCSTPTFIDHIFSADGKAKVKSVSGFTHFAIPMADPNYDVKYEVIEKNIPLKSGSNKVVKQTVVSDQAAKLMPSGNPNRLNQMMILPLLPYTAPPRCNVLFPSLYKTISYAIDYDADTTRAMGLIPHYFKSNVEDVTNFWAAETFFYPSIGAGSNKLTPTTLDEYRKGVIPFVHTMNQTDAKTAAELDKKRAATITKKKLAEDIAAVSSGTKDEIKKNVMVDELKKKQSDTLATIEKEAAEAYSNDNADTSPKPNNTSEAKTRIVRYEYLFKKHLRRQINVSGPFNPYSVCGFPMLLLKEDTRDTSTVQVPQSMIGLLITKTHTIDAQAMTADTVHTLSHFRPVNEATAFDEFGQQIFSKPHGLRLVSDYNFEFWEKYDRSLDSWLPNEENFRTMYRATIGPENAKIMDRNGKEIGTAASRGISYMYYKDIESSMSTSKSRVRSRSEKELLYMDLFKKKFLFARDFSSYVEVPSKDKKGNKTGVSAYASGRAPWLDYFWSPQVIGRVYAGALYNKKSSDPFDGSFMLNYMDGDINKCSSYATIHEAVYEVFEKSSVNMVAKNFDEALEYVWRPICTESQFYLGIMDCISSEMKNSLLLDAFPVSGGKNIPSESDEYPNFDSDLYIPANRYFQYGSWKGFWNEYKKSGDDQDLVGHAITFNDDRTMDFYRQDGRCFDIESFLSVSNYYRILSGLPFGSNIM